ncbi:MAG: Gldg family protein [Gemmatimonadetes bacterium]|nr:Gldg family protein [Gemmatimonadota bacterium]
MKQALTIARRELRGYFDHPTAYILIVAFLALGLFLAFRTILAQRVATLRPLFDLLPWLFAVFVPAMTMRSLAEERRSRTLEWLMGQPLGETEVVIGKFIGDWLFSLIAIAATLPAAVGILLASSADPGIVLAQYVGSALLAAQFVAIGIWASSVTKNQITAFIIAASISLLLILIGLPVVLIGLPPVIGGIVARLSVVPHFDSVARGVVDLRDLLYFVTTAAFFLVLAGTALARERLSHKRGAWRRLRTGAATIAALVIVINLLGGSIHGRIDLTRDRLYTLSEGTRTLVAGLDDLVQIKLFTSNNLQPEVQLLLRDVRDLLNDFRRAGNDNLVITERNPDSDEDAADEARGLGITPIDFNVVRDDNYQVMRGWFGLAVVYANEQRTIPLVDRTDDLEFRLAAHIATLTADEKPRIAFLTGWGARGPFEFQTLREALGDRYELTAVNLQQDTVPALPADSFRVVVVAAPAQPFDSTAVQRVRDWVDSGGSALFLLENTVIQPQYPQPIPASSGLEPLLEASGVAIGDGLVYDMRSHANVSVGRQGFFNLVRGYPLWPIVLRAGEHTTTRDLENLSLGWVAPLRVTDTTRVQPLWATTEDAGMQPAGFPIDPSSFIALPSDTVRSQIVAVAIDPGARASTGGAGTPNASGGRMIVVGDADFLSDQFVQANPQNLIFVANALDWLAQDELLIRIRSKHRTPPALVFESDFGRNALKWGNLIGVPLLFIAFGTIRITGRRRRAERRWADLASTTTAPGPTSPAPPDGAAREAGHE